MSNDLESLSIKREKWVVANRENGFEEGITNLLTQLYPDNAHFIYELLQNAEDPLATDVKFKVTTQSVEFEHNGERLFDIKDVESITSIGKSTKRDDPTRIGKFGVGFKAVFAYTNTPEIHSGEFGFRIRNLVVPDTINITNNTDYRKTRFIFPFDNPDKPPKKAIDEVERGLRALGDNTLLFLSHIHSIKYELHDRTTGSLQRLDHDDGRIEIKLCHPDGEKISSNWLRFHKDVSVVDEDGREKSCRIAIAYALVKEDKKDENEKLSWKIIPVKKGQVSIFFPADKETSNLHFHLHAPFASTVARDSVRDCDANNQLRDHISSLVVESLEHIRDKGMLSMEALGVLPNGRDNIPSFYEPIRLALVDAFKNKPLTPTKNGKYAPASSLYRGPAKISAALDDNDIAELTRYKTPFWAGNPPQLHQREDQFLDSLDIALWGWWELSLIMQPDKEQGIAIEKLISKKDDKWLQRFYSLLGEVLEDQYKTICLENCRVVRIDKNGLIDHALPKDAFFPPSEKYEINLPDNIFFVKKDVYEKGRSTTAKEYASAFLHHIGVREFNPRTIIELNLNQHDSKPYSYSEVAYYNNLKQYVNYWKSNPEDLDLFRGHKFLLGNSSENKLYWCSPQGLVLASPYEETGLEDVIEVHSKHVLWRGYVDKFSAEEIKDFMAFLKAIGVMYKLKIVTSPTYLNPNTKELRKEAWAKHTHTGINIDFTIDGLEYYLGRPSQALSKLIWICLIKADAKHGKARYRPNRQYTTRESPSQMVCLLKDNVWIPNRSGDFKKPSEVSVNDLRSDFPYDDSNGLLTAIGFGEEEKKLSSEYLQKDSAAKAAGFDDAEEQEKWRKVKELGVSADDLLYQYSMNTNDSANYERPERSSGNSDLRQKRLAEEAVNAPERIGEKRTRTIQTNKPIVKEAARLYLTDNYTNSDDSMSCQICKAELPFRQRDGSYYFEAVEFLPEAEKFYPQNYLSLCPNHAAMFRLVNDSESSLKSELENVVDEVELPVVLAGEEYSIYFTERHIEDLKTILSVDSDLGDSNSNNASGQGSDYTVAQGSTDAILGYGGVSFPAGLDEWKKGFLYEESGQWLLATTAGKVVARFPSKLSAQRWWEKFAEQRGILSIPPLKAQRPKPKARKNPLQGATSKPRASMSKKNICHYCNGSGKGRDRAVCSHCLGVGRLAKRA